MSASPRSSSLLFPSGFSTIELLIVLAVLGILAAIAAPNLRTPPARLAANSVAAVTRQAKFEAIKTNRPMVVSFGQGENAVQVRRSDSATTIDCTDDAAPQVDAVLLAEYPGASVNADVIQMVWLPNGQLRSCGGGSIFTDVEIDIEARDSRATVLVTPGGEVTVQ